MLLHFQNYGQRSQAGIGGTRRGHYRSPSMEFKEITKKDAETSLAQELDKLRRTGVGIGNLTKEQGDMIDRDFDGFKRLFAKYLSGEAKAGIDWAKIETLPDDSVGNNVMSIYRE